MLGLVSARAVDLREALGRSAYWPQARPWLRPAGISEPAHISLILLLFDVVPGELMWPLNSRFYVFQRLQHDHVFGIYTANFLLAHHVVESDLPRVEALGHATHVGSLRGLLLVECERFWVSVSLRGDVLALLGLLAFAASGFFGGRMEGDLVLALRDR